MNDFRSSINRNNLNRFFSFIEDYTMLLNLIDFEGKMGNYQISKDSLNLNKYLDNQKTSRILISNYFFQLVLFEYNYFGKNCSNANPLINNSNSKLTKDYYTISLI